MFTQLGRFVLAFSLSCVLAIALPGVVHAQTYCTGTCVPTASDCQSLYGSGGATYVDNDRLPATCPETCSPTREQCSGALVTCPAVDNRPCTEPTPTPIPGIGGHTTPRTPRARPRPAIDDICEAGAEPDPDHPGTCRCVEGANFGPVLLSQPWRHSRRWRMEMRDRAGAGHAACYVDVLPQLPAPQPTPQTLPAPTGVTRDEVNDMIREGQRPGLTREEAQRMLSEGVNNANAEHDRRISALENRPQFMLGAQVATSFLHVNLPGEPSFTLIAPALGGSLRVNWPNGTRLTIELFGQVGWVDTGHVCSAVAIDGGMRVGWSIGEGRTITPHVGWSGSWANVPCHAPLGGEEVADGVFRATGPTAGVTVRIWDGLHIGGEFRWSPFSRFTETWSRDVLGASSLGGQLWLGYRFFGP